MLTNKGKYGIKAMVHLARLEAGETAQIAQRNNISKKFLDPILLDLRRHAAQQEAPGWRLRAGEAGPNHQGRSRPPRP
ncbi:hypothetical protein BLM15_28090 [Bosea sp. Tri-49]|nr:MULTISPECIES: hypothetical protein [unclassified Bosea (in: a-proteobacteria)]AZO80996.1 hypothetical protein BLM15_28090 [Bosea sp. Tri-49]